MARPAKTPLQAIQPEEVARKSVRINRPIRETNPPSNQPRGKGANLLKTNDISNDEILNYIKQQKADKSKILTRSDLVSKFGDGYDYDELVGGNSITMKYPSSYRGPVKGDTYYLDELYDGANKIKAEEERRYKPKWLAKEGINPDFDWRKYGAYFNEGKIIPELEDEFWDVVDDGPEEVEPWNEDVQSYRDEMFEDEDISPYFEDDDYDLTTNLYDAIDDVSRKLNISKDRVKKYLFGGEKDYDAYSNRVFGAAPDLISDPGTQGIMAQLTSTPQGNKALLSSIEHIKRLYPYWDDKQVLTAAIDDLSQEYGDLYETPLTYDDFLKAWQGEEGEGDDWYDSTSRLRELDPRLADIMEESVGGWDDEPGNDNIFYGLKGYDGRDDWSDRYFPAFRFTPRQRGTRQGIQNDESGILKYFALKDNPPKSVYGTEYGNAIDSGNSWKDQIRIAKELVNSGKLNESDAIAYLTSYTNFDDKMKQILLDNWSK